MKKMTMVLGVACCAVLLVNPLLACDGKNAKQANNDGAYCAKAATEQASNESERCSKSAAVETSYEGATCSNSAAKAAYAKAAELKPEFADSIPPGYR